MKYLTETNKSPRIAKLIDEAIDILVSVGIPYENKTKRSLERMAMAFLAVAGVTKEWTEAVDNRFLKTRDIIDFNNIYFEEQISSGSYDDIRRKDLKLLVLANLVLNSSDKPNAATNDPTRGYNLETNFMNLIKTYGTDGWHETLQNYLESKTSLKDELARKRNLDKLSVVLPDTIKLELSTGQHNSLQKLIIEEFLPRFGQNSQVLYVGDAANKMLYINTDKLNKINFFYLSHDKLPDIIAYDESTNWLQSIRKTDTGDKQQWSNVGTGPASAGNTEPVRPTVAFDTSQVRVFPDRCQKLG
jgi:type II restriction enzyme